MLCALGSGGESGCRERRRPLERPLGAVQEPVDVVELLHVVGVVGVRLQPGVDHFDIYDGPPHEAVVADEIEFLSRHLLSRNLCGETKAASELRRVYLPAFKQSRIAA